ncbi:MAG: imidazolonepropionase [Pseudomonadota bacterium]
MPARLFTNATLATMAGAEAYGLIPDGAVMIDGERIAWVGAQSDLPAEYAGLEAEDVAGRLITPAPIDCHTHLVFGGNRAREFEMRLEGASYEEVARAGGGIVSTVKATREASEEELVEGALPRLDALIAEGITTVEIKSGYGLDIETEFRMLRAARRLADLRPVRVELTYLGAHAIPPEYAGREDAFIDEVVLPSLDRADGLFNTVDGFCEGIAFSPDQIRRVFEAAKVKGMRVKLHAEQLSNLGGAALAAEFGALSADHLEYLDDAGIAAMAQAGTVAVLLPGAFYTLREARLPPVQGLRDAGVPIALATDCNPGSSPLTSILLTLNMACTLFRMTPEEALAGITRNAARALGREDLGTIEAGKIADLAIWDVEHPAELSYRIGFNPLHRRIFGGAG